MYILRGALKAIRILMLLVTFCFVTYQIINFGYHVLLIITWSDYQYLRVINFVSITGAIIIVLLAAVVAFGPTQGIQHEPAVGFLGRAAAFWQSIWFALLTALVGVALGILLLVLLPFVGIDLRLRWVIALWVIVTAAALIISSEQSRALLGHIRLLGRSEKLRIRRSGQGIEQSGGPPPNPASDTPTNRQGASRAWRTGSVVFRRLPKFCAALSRFLESLSLQAGSKVATRIEDLGRRSVPAAREQWRDGVALAFFAGIKVYLLINFGIYSWHDNDGAGYIALAAQFERWATWVSVPDLASTVVPLSLLRIPGYPLVILLMQAAAGDFWIPALIALQMAVSLLATFVLYRAIWRFSGLWFFAILGAGWFALSYIGYFERMILSDSLTLSLFTIVACWIGSTALQQRVLGPRALAAIAMALPLLFLLREANMIFTLSLAPLLWIAVPQKRRLASLAIVYAPLVGVFLLIGVWQQFRTGYFLITTGGQANPIEALALANKISPVLDQEGPVDRTIRGVTADKTTADIERDSWSLILRANQLLAAELKIDAPELSRLLLGRYFSVWWDHPHEMLAYMSRNQGTIHTAGVSPFIVNDQRLSEKTRGIYSFVSQQVIEWGLINLPIFWFGILITVAGLRRTALLAVALSLAAIIPIVFYSAMFLESRYVLPTFAPMLLVVALSLGVVRLGTITRQILPRRRLARPEKTALLG